MITAQAEDPVQRSVTITVEQAERMSAVVAAVERAVALPAYREATLVWAPAESHHDPGTRGALLGYDFHLTPDGPRLIEINTNAGGLLMQGPAAPPLEAAIVAMFRDEWRLSGGRGPLARVAIIDEQPTRQFLHPEFLAFRSLLSAHGIETRIGGPEELELAGGRLLLRGAPVELVYNRLTDFPLEESAHAVLREAWMGGAAVVTPHPHAHALYADKRNLTLLHDHHRLRELGCPTTDAELLAESVPPTETVTAHNADRLWRERRGLFFKPARGYGSRGSYRGDKLTLRVWREIVAGDYVAQTTAPPSRVTTPGGELKLDLRHYVYAGRTLALGARLYRGQTTNLRTPGGGLATVSIR